MAGCSGRASLRRGRRSGGFTLIEVVVVMAIVAILAAIAIPNYAAYIARGHRSEARMTLTQAAQWMERWRTQSGGYLNPPLPPALQQSPASGNVIYNIAVASTAGAYILTATPTGPMANDECGALTLDQTGQRTAAGNMQLCWGR
jgi:type IV pilus assembly protein PilE